MKGPLIATGAVVIVGLALSWQRQAKVSAISQELDGLYDVAEEQGIPLAMKTSVGRRDRVLTASLAEEVADLLRRTEAVERAGGHADEMMRDKMVDLSVQLMDLSPAELRKVLGTMRANESISDATKSEVIGTAILFISSDHPQQALRLLEESREVLGKGIMTDHAVASALESWAGRDPSAALQWIKTTEKLPPGTKKEELLHAVLGGAAESNPLEAFRMLPSLGLEDLADAAETIAVAVATSTRGRDSLVQGMRDYLSLVDDPAVAREISSSVMATIGEEVERDSFDEMSGWLAAKNFSNDELASFADGLDWFATGKQTGDWIEWIAGNVEADQVRGPVEGLMGDWVEEDYIAAGKWLSSAPSGPAKAPAVMAYAEAVAAYDPGVATDWAMTLGDDRMKRKTLQAIHDNWPDDDDEGAARFSAEHGLE